MVTLNVDAIRMNTNINVLERINASFRVDARLVFEDIATYRVHAEVLCDAGILTSTDLSRIEIAFVEIKQELAGTFPTGNFDDVHEWVDASLRARIGKLAGTLQAARARNDQAVTDLKLYVRRASVKVMRTLLALVNEFGVKANLHVDTVMPGFTHTQKAQPITFGFYCAAFAETFLRDIKRLLSFTSLMDECPLGAGAIAGVSFPIDRHLAANRLGFSRPTRNALDAVASRDFALDFQYACLSIGLNLSRFAEDVVVWTSQPFDMVHLPDHLVTTSSIMPHKRNPDAAQILRSKSGRLAGNFHTLAMVLKGLAPAYAKDLQEDKEAVFDSMDTVIDCLEVARILVEGLQPKPDSMLRHAASDFCTSTDFVDLLVRERGLPFDEAHHYVTALVKEATKRKCSLGQLPTDVIRRTTGFEPPHDWASLDDPRVAVRLKSCFGGCAAHRVREALLGLQEDSAFIESAINNIKLESEA